MFLLPSRRALAAPRANAIGTAAATATAAAAVALGVSLLLTGCGAGPADPTDAASVDATKTPAPTASSTPGASAPAPSDSAASGAAESSGAATQQPAAEPTWAMIDGTWCSASDPTDCITIADQVDVTWNNPVTFEREHNGCFVGAEPQANVLFCPAGVATPGPDLKPSLGVPEGDNAAFDRLWIYTGQGAVTYFRDTEVAAATV